MVTPAALAAARLRRYGALPAHEIPAETQQALRGLGQRVVVCSGLDGAAVAVPAWEVIAEPEPGMVEGFARVELEPVAVHTLLVVLTLLASQARACEPADGTDAVEVERITAQCTVDVPQVVLACERLQLADTAVKTALHRSLPRARLIVLLAGGSAVTVGPAFFAWPANRYADCSRIAARLQPLVTVGDTDRRCRRE